MAADRTIGRTVKIKTYQALVELLPETSSYVKSSCGGLYAIAVINSFVVIPVGSERVVAVVTSLDMAEEAEASMQHRQMLVIARPRRTMWVSMIGTLTQTHKGKTFEYGVKRYPELDNPVWFASEEDLDIIFDKEKKDDLHHVAIGKSPIFTDYDVSIDIDQFFGKHAAILGNTGSGKSCTVTADEFDEFKITVEQNSAQLEVFDNLSMDPEALNFVERVVGANSQPDENNTRTIPKSQTK
jgi:Helicase HerA, central domain